MASTTGILANMKLAFSPVIISREPIKILLNASPPERDELTTRWRNTKLRELNYVGITAALLASLFGAAVSRPAASKTTTWVTPAFWYSGLMFIIASITVATQQSVTLNRFSSHSGDVARLRMLLGYEDRVKRDRWRPRPMQIFIWQLPVLMLRCGMYFFPIGLLVLVWDTAYRGGDWNEGDRSVAVMFTAFAAVALSCHALSAIMCHPSRIHQTD